MLPVPTSFAARWDSQLRVCTLLICTLVIGLALAVPPRITGLWFIRGGLLIMLVGVWAWAPRAYRIDGNELIVRRWIGSIRISLLPLKDARLMPPEELRGAARIWAVGCCFGYYGRFLNGLDPQTWYVTDRQSCVRLDCAGGVVVVSPSRPADFLLALPAFFTRS